MPTFQGAVRLTGSGLYVQVVLHLAETAVQSESLTLPRLTSMRTAGMSTSEQTLLLSAVAWRPENNVFLFVAALLSKPRCRRNHLSASRTSSNVAVTAEWFHIGRSLDSTYLGVQVEPEEMGRRLFESSIAHTSGLEACELTAIPTRFFFRRRANKETVPIAEGRVTAKSPSIQWEYCTTSLRIR